MLAERSAPTKEGLGRGRLWGLRTLGVTLVLLPPLALAPRTPAAPRALLATGLAPASGALPSPETGCPRFRLPDGDVCVAIPGEDEGLPEAPVSANLHRERTGRWSSYDQIPRRPDRPAAYDAYRYPVPPPPSGRSVLSGYDLDQPDHAQRRGPTLRAIGHGGVDLPQTRGETVRMVTLDGQRGSAQVLYVGPLFGTTVVTRHTLQEGGETRDYLLLFGHLEGAAPGLTAGTLLADGDVVGFVGDTGSPELVHLHLEARRVRPGVDAAKVTATALLAPEISIVCDPRNVLPLR